MAPFQPDTTPDTIIPRASHRQTRRQLKPKGKNVGWTNLLIIVTSTNPAILLSSWDNFSLFLTLPWSAREMALDLVVFASEWLLILAFGTSVMSTSTSYVTLYCCAEQNGGDRTVNSIIYSQISKVEDKLIIQWWDRRTSKRFVGMYIKITSLRLRNTNIATPEKNGNFWKRRRNLADIFGSTWIQRPF